MSRKIINTEKAPAPIGPYSQAVKTGNLIFVSGQVALVPGTNEFVNENVTQEAKQVLENIKSILEAAGLNFSHIIKTTIFLSDMALFSEVNEIYATYFDGNFPARETVAVLGLPKNARVEISVIAAEDALV